MSDRPTVAIFWDYENCNPPANASGLGFDIVNNIRRIARLFGSVSTFRAYLDISAQSPKSVVLRSELQSSGVSIIDCPHNGRKDVVDKMILVDMLAFAIDHLPPATVILITGDRDYAYAMSILKLRRYQVILVAPSSPQPLPCLESQASLVIDWGVAILRNRTDSVDFTQTVRQPYLDLDPNLVAKVLGELQDPSPDDPDTALQPCSTSSQPTTISRLRRISARDLLEPAKHPTHTGALDSTQESAHTTASPKPSTSTGDDSVLGGPSVPRTPPRSRHPSISVGSTRARGATIVAQSPPVPEQRVPAKNPPQSGVRDTTEVASPTHHPDCLPLLPFDPFGSPFHDNCSTSELPGSVKVTALSSRGLNCMASPFVLSKPPAGLESVSNPCMVKPVSFVATPTKSLVSRTTVSETPQDIGLLKETERKGLDKDGNSERSTPHRVWPRNVTDTPKFNYRPYFAYSPSRRNAGLSPDGESSSGKHTSPPAPMFLGIIDDDRDSAQSATSSRESSAPDHSALDSTWNGAGLSTPPFKTGVLDESEWRQKWSMFKTLIHLLRADHEKGIARPSRSTIAVSLIQSDKQVYQRVGMSKFRDYTALAEREGIIELGGREGDAWMALRPNWFGIDDMMTAHDLSSRVMSPRSDPLEVVANLSLMDSKNPLMEGASSFPAWATPSPWPDESGKIMSTTGIGRQNGASVPAQFRPLIDIFIREGSHQMLRSSVGQLLGQDVYAQAGVTGFKEYVYQANEAQLVECGGVGGHAWIRLHPELRT